ncbi:MAG TPA: serine/threonine-protein kinase, partial [Nocardioides sp.]|nr:serine/threonine-protein kinase [Nocardioides sp.]
METDTLLSGRYRLGARVGSGGMADVHRATDELLGREVAVKVLRASDADRDRFAAEACTVARLNHPGIVTVLDAGLDEDRPFIVMELVEGPTLAEALAAGPLDPDRVRAIGEHVAAALAYAHEQAIVHRDVKPGNVLLRPDGTACLADFGIACMVGRSMVHTTEGLVVGSPAYVAPEQVAAEDVGPAADVYSLGLVLLEALTGRRAFEGTGVDVAYARMRSAPTIPVSLGTPWVTALAAMTARDPAERPAAADVAGMLAGPVAAPGEETVSFTPAGTPSRHRRAAGAVLAAVVALVAALVAVGVADGTDRASVVPPAAARTTAAARQEPASSAPASPTRHPVAR